MQVDRIYNPYISESIFFKPEQMYGENRKVFKELPFIVKGNIYFLAERYRVRVNPDSLKLSKDAMISFQLILSGSRSKRIKIEAAPLFIGLGEMFKEVFGDSKKLQENMVKVDNHPHYLKLLEKSNKASPLIGVSCATELQNNKNIALRIHTPDGKQGNLPFSIHSILSEFEIDIGDFPKVLYIGKSEKLNDRIYRHERIQEALAVVDDENDIYLYSCQFDDSRLIIEKNNNIFRREEVDDIDTQDRISLMEMSLINYFKPVMNTDYVDSDLNDSSIFQRALKSKYNSTVIEVDHEGGFWNFGSDKVQPALRHQIEYQVNANRVAEGI